MGRVRVRAKSLSGDGKLVGQPCHSGTAAHICLYFLIWDISLALAVFLFYKFQYSLPCETATLNFSINQKVYATPSN